MLAEGHVTAVVDMVKPQVFFFTLLTGRRLLPQIVSAARTLSARRSCVPLRTFTSSYECVSNVTNVHKLHSVRLILVVSIFII